MAKDNEGNWFKRHKVASAIIGILVFLSIIGALTDGNDTSSKTSSQPAAANTPTATKQSTSSEQTVVKLNQPASDGKFQFTVTAFKCGDTSITQPDTPELSAQAQGQFCTMNLTVKNTNTVAQSFDDSAQYIYDSTNKQFSASSDGTIYANPSGSQFDTYPTVNPGVSISGVIAFDVPKGVTPTYAVLHDSSASNGVKVNLQ